MSKRYAAGPLRPRKRTKGSSYASVDLDLPDERLKDTEIIRVWDVTTSKTSGRVSATRKTHLHVNEGVSKPTREEQTPIVEDVGTPTDHEPNKRPPTKRVAKRRKQRIVKENDSVSSVPMPPHKLMVMSRQTRMADWLRYLSIILDELLRADGLGDLATPGLCVQCMKLVGEYRCRDCLGDEMYCSGCIVSSHHRLPLHRLQVRREQLSFGHIAEILSLGLDGRVFQACNP